MSRKKWAVLTALALLTTGCGSSIKGAMSHRDVLANGSESGSTPAPESAPASVPGAPAPAAADASPYVVGFGDLSVVSLPAGAPGEVTIVASSDTVDPRGAVNMVVRNNTTVPVGRIDVTGTARDGGGALVGSGSSQGFQPQLVAPGEIAFGYVYFGSEVPVGSTFEFTVSPEGVGDYFLPVTITEINNTGGQIVGAATNDLDLEVSGPIGADIICFGTDGSINNYINSYLEQEELPPGGTGSFSADLYGEDCSTGLAAASGYDL